MDSSIESKRKKLLIYGDENTGKTSLLIHFTHQMFCKDYVPRTFENVVKEVEVDGRRVELLMCEAQGFSTMYDFARVAFNDVDVVLMCFSLISLDSYHILPELVERVKSYVLDKAPIVLVGTKNDENQSRDITLKMGSEMAKQINAVHYAECSSKTGEGVKEVFEAAVRSVLKPRRRSITYLMNLFSQEHKSQPDDKPKGKRLSQN